MTSLRSGYTWKASSARYMYSEDSLVSLFGSEMPDAADASPPMRSGMRSWSSSIASSAVPVRFGVSASPREDTMHERSASFMRAYSSSETPSSLLAQEISWATPSA